MADPNSPFFRRNNPNNPTNNPYQNLYNLPTSPEFLFHEEAAAKTRSWSENLQFYTGAAYLTGAIVGGTKGTVQGLMSSEPGDTTKLKVNRILNSGGHTGRKFGNSLGILGLIYGGLESFIMHHAGTDDVMSSVLAGLGTGAIYKAASGPRSAALAGAIGGLAAGAAVAGKQVILPAVKRYVPNIPI